VVEKKKKKSPVDRGLNKNKNYEQTLTLFFERHPALLLPEWLFGFVCRGDLFRSSFVPKISSPISENYCLIGNKYARTPGFGVFSHGNNWIG